MNHVFETEETGGLEPIYLSSNNNGVVFQTKVVGGYEGDPAVQEQLTETYIMPSGSAATPTVWATEILTVIGAGDVYLLDSVQQQSPTAAAILGTDTPAEAAAKIRALTLTGMTVSGEGAEVIITSNTAGSPVGFPVTGRIDGEPGAVPGILTFTGINTLTWGTDEGGARKENASYLFEGATVVGGTVRMYFNSTTPVNVAIGSGDSVSQAIDKLVAAVPTGWDGLNLQDVLFNITAEVAEAKSIRVNIDWNGAITSVVDDISPIDGIDASGSLIPGDISVYYNSAEATLVTLDGSEDLAGVYEAIALSAPEGYTATDDASIVILKTVAGANVIPLSIDLGSTGITKDTSVLIPGEDADNDNVPKATSVATEFSIDTISNVRSGTALWNEIETIASGNTKLASVAYPVTAVRLNVKTAARDATAQVILRTSA